MAALASANVMAAAQSASDMPGGPTATIKAESRLVLVDVVVTDKKGNYVEDLTKNNFRVYQDDQEQKVSSFSFENAGSNGQTQKRYLVMFFDDDSMQPIDQSRARLAAVKFLETNAAAGNYFSILDFAGTLQLAQGFTDDIERLKRVAGAPKMANASSENASLGQPVFASYDSYSNRNVLLALRSVARNLASIPGRKSIIWLTAGFPMSPEHESEVTALISACNRANVAVYPLDVRGLVGGVSTTGRLDDGPLPLNAGTLYQSAQYGSATFTDGETTSAPRLIYVQAKPGGGGTTGGTGAKPPGGTTGTTGTRPPGTVTRTMPSQIPNPFTQQPRSIVPPMPTTVATNQQVLFAVATGTGGFVITNSNDLLGGLGKIGKEQNEYYILGFVPPDNSDNACHTLQVKLDRSGYVVRSRSGYCATKPADLLAGKPLAKTLEERARGKQPSAIPGSVSAPYFYTSPDTARVNLALEIPSQAMKFEKVKGRQQATFNILGMALKPDGSVAARFSDTVDVSLDKDQMESFLARPYHYENQFYIANGQYTLKIAVSSGDKFGQFEMPLVVDHYDASKFTMSDLALSTRFMKVSQDSVSLDAELLQDRTPLVTQGLQMLPSGSNKFKPGERVAIYLEVYEPASAQAGAPKVGLRMRIVDSKTGEKKLEANVPETAASVIAGNPMIPMGVPLPVDRLQPGSYLVELQATDASGRVTPVRKAEFAVE